jgi:hypothetical protein
VDAAQGSVSVNPDGTLAFTPAPNFTGTAVITYTVTDGSGRTANATATVTVTPVNDAPTARPDIGIVPPSGTLLLDLIDNDGDTDGDVLTISAIDGEDVRPGVPIRVNGGSVLLNPDGKVVFTADPGFGGDASFSYTVVDGNGGSAIATATLQVTRADAPDPMPDRPESQPQPQQAQESADTPTPRIATDGIILNTVESFGGLGSGSRSLTAERPLLNAVNGVSQLDSAIELDAGQGRILTPARLGLVHGSSESHAFATGERPLGLPFDGPIDLRLSGLTRLSIDGRMDSGILTISLRMIGGGSRTLEPARVTASLPDGSALPPWLSWTRDSVLTGSPPPGVETIDVLFRGEDSDGRPFVRQVTIDLRNGAVVPAGRRDIGQIEAPPLFSEQVRAAFAENDKPVEAMSLAEILRSR